MKHPIAALLTSLAISAAHASEPAPANTFSKDYQACMEKAGPPGFYDQSAQGACVDAEVKRLKQRINKAYGKLVKLWADNPEGIAQLDKAQKAWVEARDATLLLLQEHGGGNGQVAYLVSTGYLLDALAERAALLEQLVASNGGE